MTFFKKLTIIVLSAVVVAALFIAAYTAATKQTECSVEPGQTMFCVTLIKEK